MAMSKHHNVDSFRDGLECIHYKFYSLSIDLFLGLNLWLYLCPMHWTHKPSLPVHFALKTTCGLKRHLGCSVGSSWTNCSRFF